VHHPAPFPVALPERLILLYTYEDDLVLDPFMGSGSTLVAAAQHRRRYVGYDLDPEYVDLARSRVDDATVAIPPTDGGKAAAAFAGELIEQAGFTITGRNCKLRGTGVTVPYIATDVGGHVWYFDVSGAFTSARAGLRRTDTLWKALGRAAVLNADPDHILPIIFLTTDLPPRGSAGHLALRAGRGRMFVDAVEMQSAEHFARLAQYATGESRGRPIGDDLLAPHDTDG
jgi:site-specific DNA-methyltransferase (adenine-specific)